jgi:hypothetical protein
VLECVDEAIAWQCFEQLHYNNDQSHHIQGSDKSSGNTSIVLK